MNAAKRGNHNLFIVFYAKGRGSCLSWLLVLMGGPY